jgi:sugar lactone lactonase YvrE
MNIRPTIITILAVCTALWAMPGAARGQTPTPSPGDLFVSVNLGGSFNNPMSPIYQYAPAGPPPSIFAPNLTAPRGLAFDHTGNLFVATNIFDDAFNCQAEILKITPGGAVSCFFPTVAGTCPPTSPPPGFPFNFFLTALATDSAGNVFVAGVDQTTLGPSTIYKITPDGIMSTFGPIGSIPGICNGLAFDSAGNLFATDGVQTIYKFTPDASQSIFVNDPTLCPPGGGPTGLAFDAAGNLFVSGEDCCSTPGASLILKFGRDGTASTVATGLTSPRGLAFDSAGNLFVAEHGLLPPGDILKFTLGGSETIVEPSPAQQWPCRPNDPNALVQPRTIAGIGWGVAYFDQGAVTCDFVPNVGVRSNRGPFFLTFAPGSNTQTPAGSNVTTNAGTVGFATISLTFPQVASPGTTTVLPVNPSSIGYTLPGSSLAFDITTTAAYPTPVPTPPGIVIAFQVAPPLDVSQLTVFHNENGNLVNVTCPDPRPGPTPDLTRNTIYASVTSLSPFVVAKVPFAAHVQQPINSDGTSVFSVRRGVVPVKFTLTQDGSQTCVLPSATIAVTRTIRGTLGAIDESVYSGSADTGSNFRISSCQYVYNLSASALGVGTYRVDIKIGGVLVGSATFGLQ